MILLALILALQPSNGDTFGHLRDQWASDLRDKKVEASVALYASDADFIQPDGSRVHGTAALRELFKTVTASYDSHLVFSSIHVEQSGDLAYDSGTYNETLTARATGKAQKISGSYLTIYREEKNGAWRIVQQVWTFLPQTGMPEPPN